MDNLTHTLVSALVGETAQRFTPDAQSGLPGNSRRNLAIGLMMVGGNLPDADLFYTGLGGNSLDYVLHHRGHTHTVIGALLISVVLYCAVRAWWRYRRLEPSPHDGRFLIALALLAPLLHLGFDFTNSYGLHPFWPVDNRWFYGDAVFIVEPLLWACATPLLFTLRSALTRALVALVLLAGIALSIGTGLVPLPLAAALTVFTVALAAIGRLGTARTALASGVGAWLLLTVGFFVSGNAADARISTILGETFPGTRTLDRVLTPMPVNPFCREVFLVQIEGDRYLVRKATHALLPEWIPASDCPLRTLGGESTAPLRPMTVPSSDEIAWGGELSMPRDLPATLASDYCAVRALLKFARVPWMTAQEDGWLVGDLRYDREPELGMAEVEVGPAMDECPRRIPPWVEPRKDLLTR